MLNALWREAIRPSLVRRTRELVMERGRELFGAVNDATRSAVRQTSADRRLTPAELRLRAEIGLGEIFGSDIE